MFIRAGIRPVLDRIDKVTSESHRVYLLLLEEMREEHKQLSNDINLLNKEIINIRNTLDAVSRKQHEIQKGRLTIIFLVHHIASVDSILTVIWESQKRGHNTIVVSIKNLYSSAEKDIILSEEKNHQGLTALGIEHIRFGAIDSIKGLELIKLMNPDYIFRQSPWDYDIEEGYRSNNLRFAKLCYTPYYGVQITKDFNLSGSSPDLHVDQDFHRSAYAIFVENNKETLEEFHNHAKLGVTNIVPSGLPKYEYISQKLINNKTEQKASKIILWAPHHSFSSNLLGFATFIESYKRILEEINFFGFSLIFRPHPLFEKKLLESNKISLEEYSEFKKTIEETPNFSFSQIADPIDDFNRSDMLLIDGISMLATYQLTGKPIVWIDSEQHALFTRMGQTMIESVYRVPVSNMDLLGPLLKQILIENKDPLKNQRVKFASLIVGNGSPSKNIVNFLEKSLQVER